MTECRHPDIQRFGDIRCCLSCGEAVFESASESEAISCYSGLLKYCYKPLRNVLGQEIRLIVLYAGEHLDDLVCDIIVVNLADRPVYEAVSYTWADANGDRTVTSNVICRWKSIPITKNCDAALRRLRLRSRSRSLWLDAICINQDDILEKNHQVRLMSEIYMKASQVIAYLGIEPHQVTNGLQRIIDYLQDDSPMTSEDLRMKENLEKFLGIAYFNRVWILQEVGLSQLVTLVIGGTEIRWTGAVISKILKLTSALGIQPPSMLRWSPASRPEEEKDILAVLSRGRNCSASDPRDKVYALLGLMHPKFSVHFGIDYSLSTPEVFTKLAVYCIEIGRFDILQHVHPIDSVEMRDHLSAPSWVPLWDFKDIYEPLPLQFSQKEKDLFATLWRWPEVQLGEWLRNDLVKHRVNEDILTWTRNGRRSRVEPQESTASWRKLVDHWAGQNSTDFSYQVVSPEDIECLALRISHQQDQNFSYQVSHRGTSRLTPYLRLRAHCLGKITKGLGSISNARDFYIPHTRWPALGSRHCQACIDTKVGIFREDVMKQARKDLKLDIETHGGGKAVFETEHSIGFTRHKFRLGDSVWILCGAEVPFILRSDGCDYHLIGDCYLYRAGRPFICKQCGAEVEQWPMQTEIIDLG